MTVEDQIIHCLAQQRDVSVGILFGSVAQGRARKDSDVDLAVAGSAPLSAQTKRLLIAEVAAATGRSVDLVDFSTAGLPVRVEALTKGRVIYRKDPGLYASLVTRMLLDRADFEPVRTRILRERRHAWTG